MFGVWPAVAFVLPLRIQIYFSLIKMGGLPYQSSGWNFSFQYRECGFSSWLDPSCLVAKKKPKHKNRSYIVTNLIKIF